MENFIPTNSDKLKVVKGVEPPLSINPSAIKTSNSKAFNGIVTDEFFEGIIGGDITFLSRAITLIESNRHDHKKKAQQIIDKCLPFSGKSIRIGITGVPGVGKSTFIEAMGTMLIREYHKKVAVLAVDPSSTITKGSILGDKTRMTELATEKHAFIRPSPSAGSLGGVARKTREAMILCEAAGFDIIIIETVGVGQSETTVHSMVDFFLLLMLAGAGDELQGIKRGIIEMADSIVINKADDLPEQKIKLAIRNYQNAIHLFPPSLSGWLTPVLSCSSLTGSGINDIWLEIENYTNLTKDNGYFINHRREQAKFWFYETINNELSAHFYNNKTISHKLKQLEKEVISDQISPFEAAQKLLEMYEKST